MKTIITIILAVSLISCQPPQVQSREVSVLTDRTDESITYPKNSDILKICQLTKAETHEVTLRFHPLGNSDFHRESVHILQGDPSILSNEIERMGEVEAFKRDVIKTLEEERMTARSYNHSSIIAPLISHLHKLSNSQAQNRAVYLYSDLAEHGIEFSVYDKNTRKLIASNPEQATKRLFQGQALPNLSGVTLRIIHYPSTQEDNLLFKQMLAILKLGFAETGLTITIGYD